MGLVLSATVDGEQRHWLLERSPTRLGRASGNTVQLLDGTVSKEHAELYQDEGRWCIRDLGSRNGTRVNGREAKVPLTVAAGDRIEVGHVLLQVTEAASEKSAGFSTSEHVGSALELKVSEVLQRTGSTAGDGARVFHLLAEAGQLLVLPRPLDETCHTLLGLVEKALPTSRLVMLLRDAEGSELRQVAARYRGGRAEEPLALSSTILGGVLADNTAVITSDATHDPRFLGQVSIIAQAIHSAMAVPLFDNERVLGILYADTANPAVTYTQNDLELFTLLGNMAAVKITNARLLQAEQVRQRLAQELATARDIQQDQLPDPPLLPGWSCHARIETCYEVGGDLYDLHLPDDDTLVLLVGDVVGKGMGAALLMMSTLSAAQGLYAESQGPGPFVRRLNGILNRRGDPRRYVTLFVAWVDLRTGRLRYVNAGHPSAQLVRDGQLRALASTGIPVGMLPGWEWEETELVMEPGGTLAVFTDGIPEAQRGDEFFDVERIEVALRETEGERDLRAMGDGIIKRIDEFAAGTHRSDDVALVLLRRERT